MHGPKRCGWSGAGVLISEVSGAVVANVPSGLRAR